MYIYTHIYIHTYTGKYMVYRQTKLVPDQRMLDLGGPNCIILFVFDTGCLHIKCSVVRTVLVT